MATPAPPPTASSPLDALALPPADDRCSHPPSSTLRETALGSDEHFSPAASPLPRLRFSIRASRTLWTLWQPSHPPHFIHAQHAVAQQDLLYLRLFPFIASVYIRKYKF